MLDAARSIGDHASEAEAHYSLGYIRGIEHDNEAPALRTAKVGVWRASSAIDLARRMRSEA